MIYLVWGTFIIAICLMARQGFRAKRDYMSLRANKKAAVVAQEAIAREEVVDAEFVDLEDGERRANYNAPVHETISAEFRRGKGVLATRIVTMYPRREPLRAGKIKEVGNKPDFGQGKDQGLEEILGGNAQAGGPEWN